MGLATSHLAESLADTGAKLEAYVAAPAQDRLARAEFGHVDARGAATLQR